MTFLLVLLLFIYLHSGFFFISPLNIVVNTPCNCLQSENHPPTIKQKNDAIFAGRNVVQIHFLIGELINNHPVFECVSKTSPHLDATWVLLIINVSKKQLCPIVGNGQKLFSFIKTLCDMLCSTYSEIKKNLSLLFLCCSTYRVWLSCNKMVNFAHCQSYPHVKTKCALSFMENSLGSIKLTEIWN